MYGIIVQNIEFVKMRNEIRRRKIGVGCQVFIVRRWNGALMVETIFPYLT
jgi:hypothetical protein